MALARQLTNVGARGQDARYDISGLQQVAPGVYTDGVYQYDDRGLDLSGRKAENIQGLRGADENFVDGQVSYASGGGGGGGGGIPGSAVIGQTAAQGLAEYKKALARLNQNRTNTLTRYGYTAQVDPETGVLTNQRVDSMNPYGIYQGLRRKNAMEYSSLRDAAAERHLGGKGLGAQGISDARYGWGLADTGMAQDLMQTLGGFDQEQQGAWSSYQNLLWQLELEAARQAAMNWGGGGWDPGGSPEDIERDNFTNATQNVADEWAKAAAAQNALMARAAPTVIPKSLQVSPNKKITTAALNRIQAANRRK